MSTIKISEFHPHLKNQVISLILNIQKKEFSISITAEEQPDLENIPDFYQKGNGNFWIATDQENVVGTVALLDIGSNEAALRKMFVHKDYRGKKYKIAQHLLETSLNWAKKKRIHSIFLGTTPVFLAAHRFYEKNGFCEISEYVLPPSFPIIPVDTKFYRLEVPLFSTLENERGKIGCN